MQNFNTFRLPFTTQAQTIQIDRDSGKLNNHNEHNHTLTRIVDIEYAPLSTIPQPKVVSTLTTLQHCAWVAKLNGGWYWCDHYNQLGYGLVFSARGERFTTRRECELNALANGFTHAISYKAQFEILPSGVKGTYEGSNSTKRKIKA